jgi:hypothetical protein
VNQLAEIVSHFADLGIRGFTFWVVSLHGLDQDRMRKWLPTLSTVGERLESAFDRARAAQVEATSLHTPPCVLAPGYREHYRHAGRWRLLVVVPGGEPFRAEESPMEGGEYLPSCDRCSAHSSCLGLRADYLAVYGGDEFEPIS